MTWITQAVRGTTEYDATLRQAVSIGLQEAAGYVVKQGVFVDEPQGGAIQYVYEGYNAERFHALSKYVQGYGWIAGGSALHFAQNEKIGYGDIDVFCVSQAAYLTLKDCFKSYIASESIRSCVADCPMFGIGKDKRWRLDTNLNLVAPLENQDWSHPASVLREFDLSVAAIAIIEPGLAYTPYADDIAKKEMNFIGNIRNAVHFWRRVVKYYQRGFKLSLQFFNDLILDDKGRDLVYLMRDMHDMNISQRHKDFDGEFLWACWAVNDYEQGDDIADSPDNNDDYSDGWY